MESNFLRVWPGALSSLSKLLSTMGPYSKRFCGGGGILGVVVELVTELAAEGVVEASWTIIDVDILERKSWYNVYYSPLALDLRL